nr:septum formation family protein [Micromonospora sp. DSM 115978]
MTQQSEHPGQYPGAVQTPPPAPYGDGSNPGGWQPAGPPAKQGTNGFAIASLIFGIVGGVLFSVIFGIVALTQLKRRPQGGRGLAVTGLVLSALWAVGIGIGVVLAIGSGADRNDDGEITEGGSVSSFDLTAGDCLNDLEESASITSVPAVPCAEPHEAEVFALFEVSGDAFPGDAEISSQSEEQCTQRLAEYAPAAVEDENLELFFLHPTQESWAQGDREVVCIANDPSGQRTGSLRD